MALFYPHGILTYHRDGRHDGTAAAAAISAPNHSDPRPKWLAKNNSMILDYTGMKKYAHMRIYENIYENIFENHDDISSCWDPLVSRRGYCGVRSICHEERGVADIGSPGVRRV